MSGMDGSIHSRFGESIFDWTERVEMSLLQDDREIFERKPVVMSSKIIS
jgi:hypothetical protein